MVIHSNLLNMVDEPNFANEISHLVTKAKHTIKYYPDIIYSSKYVIKY